MKLLKYIFPLLFPILSVGAQEKTGLKKITGSVMSSAGHIGIAGVSVSFKNQGARTITDSEGKFSIPDNGKRPTKYVFL